MHACPSSLEEQLHYFKALSYYKYRVVAFDMPGYGGSPGTRFPSRSDKILEKGGPADCAIALMAKLGYKKATFAGYDWGGGIAIAIAKKWPKKVENFIALLPSYNPSSIDEMKTITPRGLIMWVKQD